MAEKQITPNAPAQLPAPQNQMQTLSVFGDVAGFEAGMRIAKALSESTMVPIQYQKSLPNCLVAIEVSNRVGMSVFSVMQNMHIIEGRPAWAANFLIASVNASGRFTPLRFEREDRGQKKVDYLKFVWVSDQSKQKGGYYKQEPASMQLPNDFAYRAVTKDKATGEQLVGPWVSLEMAVQEGWYHRKGSKYQTLPDQMLMYRAASFFSRLYCPEISLGMHTPEEAMDAAFEVVEPNPPGTITIQENPDSPGTVAGKINKAARAKAKNKPDVEDADAEPVLPDTPPPPADQGQDAEDEGKPDGYDL